MNINEYGLWSVILIEFIAEETAIVSMISSDDEAAMFELQKITPIETIQDDDGEILNYVIDPEPKELSQLIDNKLFSSVSTFHKIEHQ